MKDWKTCFQPNNCRQNGQNIQNCVQPKDYQQKLIQSFRVKLLKVRVEIGNKKEHNFKIKFAYFRAINVRAQCLINIDHKMLLFHFTRPENFDVQNGIHYNLGTLLVDIYFLTIFWSVTFIVSKKKHKRRYAKAISCSGSMSYGLGKEKYGAKEMKTTYNWNFFTTEMIRSSQ